MSRIKYAFADPHHQVVAHADGIRARIPSSAIIRDRRYLRMSLETIGLFLFGFGSTALLMHIAAGFFFVSGGAAFLPSFYI